MRPFQSKDLTKLAILRDYMSNGMFCIALQSHQSWQKRVAEYDTFGPHDFTEYDHHHDLLTSALHYTSTVLKNALHFKFSIFESIFFLWTPLLSLLEKSSASISISFRLSEHVNFN